jgi:hypothetical protein
MNKHKYTAKLYDYTVTVDNFDEGEDPDTTQNIDAPAKTISFNNLNEFKMKLGRLLDNNDFYIMHNEDNRYDVQWTAIDEEGIYAPSKAVWEEFKQNKCNLYACVMQIEIYLIAPALANEFEGQLD